MENHTINYGVPVDDESNIPSASAAVCRSEQESDELLYAELASVMLDDEPLDLPGISFPDVPATAVEASNVGTAEAVQVDAVPMNVSMDDAQLASVLFEELNGVFTEDMQYVLAMARPLEPLPTVFHVEASLLTSPEWEKEKEEKDKEPGVPAYQCVQVVQTQQAIAEQAAQRALLEQDRERKRNNRMKALVRWKSKRKVRRQLHQEAKARKDKQNKNGAKSYGSLSLNPVLDRTLDRNDSSDESISSLSSGLHGNPSYDRLSSSLMTAYCSAPLISSSSVSSSSGTPTTRTSSSSGHTDAADSISTRDATTNNSTHSHPHTYEQESDNGSVYMEKNANRQKAAQSRKRTTHGNFQRCTVQWVNVTDFQALSYPPGCAPSAPPLP